MPEDKKNIAVPSRKKIFTKLVARFLRLNISQKMHLGFLPLVVLLILVSTFAIGKLNQLTSLNESILLIDIPAQETIRRMETMAIDQESILRRFIILKDNAFLEVFDNNSIVFFKHITTLKTLSGLSEELEFPLADLGKSYSSYSSALLKGIDFLEKHPDKTSEFDEELRVKQTELLGLLAEFTNIAKSNQDKKVAISASMGNLAFKFALALCIIGTALSAAGAALVTNNIVSAVKKLHHATEEIAKGRFDHLPDIKNKDELGNLAEAFITMAKRLKTLEEMYLDASPLTRLPGGVAIENMLKKRIEAKKLFAFCLLDIDNFKSFNDHYGYAQGNRMIQETADITEEIASKYGSSDDFIGHIGGDDFVIITTPDKYQKICQSIIEKFDERVPALYSDSDRKKGYIAGANRQGEQIEFPLASISIAVVTNQDRVIKNHIEVGEIAAELKEFAKSTAGSFMAEDNRRDPNRKAGNSAEPRNPADKA
jgi:diguanylate cyclase (GGDEF)-like protein